MEANAIIVPDVVYKDVRRTDKEVSDIKEEKIRKTAPENPIGVLGNPDLQDGPERIVWTDQTTPDPDPKDRIINVVLLVEEDDVVLAGKVNH